jgi:CBS domain-containing protein
MTCELSCDLRQLSAADAMNPRVHWGDMNENLREAAHRMAQHGVRALLVRGEAPSDLPGIVTTKDVVSLLGRHDLSILDQLQVRDVMTRPAICVPRQANLLDCINLMRISGVRRVPVLDGTEVVGVLSTSDVFARVLGDI